MPPSIRRQAPPAPASAAPPGSMLADAMPVAAIVEQFVRICVYGRNRAGKTSLAARFAKPLLLISSEPDPCGGASSVSNIDGVHLQRVSDKLLGKNAAGAWVDATDRTCVWRDRLKGSAKVVALANELAGEHPFKTVVLDTVTSLQDVILCELMNLPKVPEMMSWGMVPDGMYQARAEKLRETVRPLLDLRNCNVIILAQEKDHNAQEERGGKRKLLHTMQQGSFMAPALGSTNAQWLQDNCGYIVQIYEDEITQQVAVPTMNPDGTPGPPSITEVGTGRRSRHLRLLYHPNFAAGGRWQWERNVPEFVRAPSPKELYDALAKFIPALSR